MLSELRNAEGPRSMLAALAASLRHSGSPPCACVSQDVQPREPTAALAGTTLAMTSLYLHATRESMESAATEDFDTLLRLRLKQVICRRWSAGLGEMNSAEKCTWVGSACEFAMPQLAAVPAAPTRSLGSAASLRRRMALVLVRGGLPCRPTPRTPPAASRGTTLRVLVKGCLR